ncbi:AAA family ATPase [Gordonia sp. VNK1]|uniref:McrB family protein n=1 Tax=Gordonia oleivorans TaxID=3156618 RepID=UPI0032B36EC5
MSDQLVEAVFVFYYGKAAHSPTYGRGVTAAGGKSAGYTKDYLQLVQSPELREALLEFFPPNDPSGMRTNIDYKWPGGTSKGAIIFRSNDRPHLSWETSQGAPPAWKMTPNPNSTGPETIPGDPSKTTIADADAEFDSFVATGMNAYLVAIKLVDEPNTLHLRCYLASPPKELEFADAALLPTAIRNLAYSTKKTRAFGWLRLRNEGTALTGDVAALIEKLEENPNVLLVGPPGTGKTVALDRLAKYIEEPGSRILFDPDKNHAAWTENTSNADAGKVRTVVFHPNYSYDDLVVGLMPIPAPGNNGGVIVQPTPGPLLSLAHFATATGHRTALILDEFNRGNAASILGDMLALLDKDKRGSAAVDLPYSTLGISVTDEFAPNNTDPTVPSRFSLPPNLWIIAAMNSSDRSVAPLDAALRRRFSILDYQPDYNALENHLEAADDLPVHATPIPNAAAEADDSEVGDSSGNAASSGEESEAAEETAGIGDTNAPTGLDGWTPAHVARLAVDVLQAVNRRITSVLGKDFQLGPANFWKVQGPSAQTAFDALVTAWDDHLRQTLRLSFQDNDDGLAAVLLAGSSDSARTKPTKTAAWWRAAESSVGSLGQARLELTELGSLDPSDALNELRRQAGYP